MNSFYYKRVLLKISGESLMGKQTYGIDTDMVLRVAEEIKGVSEQGIEVCLVIGGGNIFRGVSGAAAGMERAPGDYVGRLATDPSFREGVVQRTEDRIEEFAGSSFRSWMVKKFKDVWRPPVIGAINSELEQLE